MVHLYLSKILPEYPWKIPRTLHQQFLKEFLCRGLGESGVSSQGYVGFPLEFGMDSMGLW